MPVTVSVVNEIVPSKTTAPEPAGQKAPARQPDAETVTVPRVVALIAQITVHEVALGEI